ncbi:MAG: hypothetical protein J6T39_01730, partial [Clostridia bacterium]|nr:hypothetical protein [Clostridia bacterium]
MKNQFKIASIFLFSLFSIILCANIIFVANLNKDVFADEEEITTLPTAYCLRDDYFVQTTNQHNQGLCWDFASSLAFTTTVMKSTNQYIDFSEAWVSNHIAATSKYYTPGDGGS